MTTSDPAEKFEALLEYLKRSRGFDFTGYKRPSLMRRIQKRMQAVNVSTYEEYVDYLEVHPGEFTHLFNTILINVTAFLRDAPAWEVIAADIVPRIRAGKQQGEPIRVWSAGCSSGEEAYTAAMMLCEALGVEEFRDRVKIYATDVDEEALNHARQATYTAREVTGIPQGMLDRYFERASDRFVFRKDLRRSIIFGRHDLIQDAPISRVDLLICRNTLMYFNAETQARILARFHFALVEGGFLFLGRAEMLFTQGAAFSPVDLKRRILAKVSHGTMRDRLLVMGQNGNDEPLNHISNHVRLREAAFDASTVAHIVIDVNGTLTLVNERARSLFSLSTRDLGRPIQDLELSYRPVELRSSIDRAYAERRPQYLREIDWPTGAGDARTVEIAIVPLMDTGSALLGVSVFYTDVTHSKRLQEELEHANQELETAYEELQSTNEELETTNEELQSTIEELETTNEELQSTNEELETMNEEMQSTNEELHTINDELRRRSDDLNQANAFLESILTSLRGGVVVVDRDLLVRVWSHRAEDMWGLRSDEVVGRHFLNLDIGLPVGELRQPIRTCLLGDAPAQQLSLPATNRRGRGITCQVTCTPLNGSSGEIEGVIIVTEDAQDAPAKI